MKREEEEFPDIGFALLPKYERNGYTLEACRAYLKKIKSEIPNTIIAFTSPENEKSIKLLASLGLTYVGDRKKGNEMLSYYSMNVENS